jgi:flagellar biosynthesis protein FlhG
MISPSRTPRAARAQAATIVAVASGKGGVGKTWLSATLAAALGHGGKRVLLVDCDLGLANVDVQLGVQSEADLNAVVRGWVDLEAAVVGVMGGAGRGGFDLVAGHSGSGALANLSLEDVVSIIKGLRRLSPHYDVILMDLSAGIDQTVIRFAQAADRVVLVTTDEPPALMDAFAFGKVLHLADHERAPPWVVINMAENRLKGRRTYDHFAAVCEQHLGFRPPLGGVILRDPRVPDAIRAQTPLSVRHPQAQAFEDAQRVAEALSAR